MFREKRGGILSKLFFTLFLLLPVTSYAQSNKPTTFKNGILSNTNIIDSSGNILSNLNINQPNGLAGLDSNGNITSNINNDNINSNTFITIGSTGGYLIYNGNSNYNFPSINRINILTAPNTSDTNVISEKNNFIPFKDLLTLGGVFAEDKMFFNVSGQPYGGGQDGVVDTVFMDGANMAQGTGVTAGPWDNMVQYLNYDAAARATIVRNAPAYFVASSSVDDPNGISHSVTFTSNGATFSPALPKEWAKRLRVNMTLMTNEIGADASNFPTSNWAKSWSNHARKYYNVYSGTLTGWNTLADGSVDSIIVDGWVIPDQQNHGLGNTKGKIPGKDTLDGSKPALDTWFTNFNSPAIMFGVYTKQFYNYAICSFDAPNSHGDVNNPNGNIGSMVHECDNEIDLWNHEPGDYRNSINGMTIIEDNTGGGKLTDNSSLLNLEGGGAMPVGLSIWNVQDNAPLIQMFGNGTRNRYNIYSPTPLGLNKGDFFVSQVSQFSLAAGGNYTSTIRWTQYRDSDANTTNDWSTSSIHLQYQQDSEENPTTDTGNPGGQIVFNPVGYRWGVGLGAGGSLQNPIYGIIIENGGTLKIPNGIDGNIDFGNSGSQINLWLGNKILFQNSTRTASGSLYLDNNNNLYTDSVILSNGMGTKTFTLANLGTGNQDGEQKYCSDCKLNNVLGVYAVWHSSQLKWLDSQNNELTN